MSGSRSEIKINKEYVTEQMKKAGVLGISIAAFDINGPTDSLVLGVDHRIKTDFTANSFFRSANLSKPVFARMAFQTELTSDSIFRAASLSKPVFACLVLKLIKDNKSGKAKSTLGEFKNLPKGKEFNLDTPLWEVFPELLTRFSEDEQIKAKKLTARLVLSHQTGLPGNDRNGIKFMFEPGTQYGYSNPAIALLQEVIDKLTGSNLQALAIENIFEDDNFKMTHSNFIPPEYLKAPADKQLKEMHAANSLHTTASDYARFVAGVMKEFPINEDENLKDHPFFSQISIENDQWAASQGLSDQERKKLGWGLGWGLQKNEKGEVVRAFHSGDMDEWRAFVAIDIESKKGIVYFANSLHGLILADSIISPNVELDAGLKYIFEKYGFARKIEHDWQKKQIDRVCKIISRYELDLPALQEKGLLTINDNKPLHTLSVQCSLVMLLIAIKKEFDAFVEKHSGVFYSFKETKDKEGTVIALEIGLHNDKLYNQFIAKLSNERLLPAKKDIPSDTQLLVRRRRLPNSVRNSMI